MHAAYQRDIGLESREATFRASFPSAPVPIRAAATQPPAPCSEYGARRRPSWAALGFIAAVHGGLVFALARLDVIEIAPRKDAPLVVELITVPPAPAPAPAEREPEPVRPVEPRIVAPAPVVAAPTPPPPVATVPTPPPPAAVIVAPSAPVSAPAGPVSVTDLASKMISAPPPRYPLESRRKHEQGTVLLSVLLGPDGAVADIGIARSSGHARLDRAALDAVRRWRWSPTMVAGQPVSVRGVVDIPFVLKG